MTQEKQKKQKKSSSLFKKLLLLILISICSALGLFCFSLGLVLSGSRDTIQDSPEIMIILGCQVMEWGPSQSLADRLDRALLYLETSPNMTIIVSGGQGDNEPTTEAYAMAQYLINNGVDKSQIYEEGNSRNTHQNLSYSLTYIEEQGLTGEILIVSSAFHLFRSKLLWSRVGGDPDTLSLAAAPVTDSPSFVQSHVREPLALVKSFLFDHGRVTL